MDGERHTVGRWRQRSLTHGLNGLQEAPRSGHPRRFSPPSERVHVLSMATRKPATYHCLAIRWSLDARVAALQPHRLQPMRRSSLWRILEEADLQPPRSVYWLNSHAPDCEATAHDSCQLSVHARRFSQQGRVVICADAKTGRPIRQRRYPPQPVQPGTPEKRAHESIRHGVRALLASCVVPTGHLGWTLGQTRTRTDWAAHVAHVVHQWPTMQRYDWVVGHLKTHWRLAVCRLMAP